MKPAVGALALAVVSLAACSSGSESDDTLPPVGTAAPAVATSVAGSPVSGPVGSGVVRMTVRLSGVSEELLLDRSTVGADDLDPITLDAACSAIDGGDGYVVSVIDVRRLSAGRQLVSATLRATDQSGSAGEHTAQLELGTSRQEITRYEGVMVLDAGLASGTFDVATDDGARATGSFACGEDLASLPTTTTVPIVVATDASVPDVSAPDVSAPAVTVPVVTAPPTPTVPLATS